jgi:hypothetical protein
MPQEITIWTVAVVGALAAVAAGLALTYRQLAIGLVAEVERLTAENRFLRAANATPQSSHDEWLPDLADACSRLGTLRPWGDEDRGRGALPTEDLPAAARG